MHTDSIVFSYVFNLYTILPFQMEWPLNQSAEIVFIYLRERDSLCGKIRVKIKDK